MVEDQRGWRRCCYCDWERGLLIGLGEEVASRELELGGSVGANCGDDAAGHVAGVVEEMPAPNPLRLQLPIDTTDLHAALHPLPHEQVKVKSYSTTKFTLELGVGLPRLFPSELQNLP